MDKKEVKSQDSFPAAKSVDADNKVVVKPSLGAIKVVALRKGFMDGIRYSEGDSFYVGSEEQLGTWMQPADPKIAEAFAKKIAAKKKR
jgi:hypothetical protein